MSTDKAFSTERALDLALEALENFADVIKYDNEQDDIGCRACCYVLSYDQHSENCKATKAITAIKQALAAPYVALPRVQSCYCPNCESMGKELAALKAQPEPVQEPLMVDIYPPATQRDRWMYEQGRLAERDPRSHTTPPAKPAPVQEPVAWRFTGIAGFKRFVTDAQYKAFSPEVRAWYEPFKCASCTTPPAAQRQWVGLTDEERMDCIFATNWSKTPLMDTAKLIEAKLKERNT
jgi:hypothetical protein